MILTVKLLLGWRCSLTVSGQEGVAMLKKLVSERLHVPEEQQHLLFRGQLLADDKRLSDSRIGPNASVSVVMRPLEKPALRTPASPSPCGTTWARSCPNTLGPRTLRQCCSG